MTPTEYRLPAGVSEAAQALVAAMEADDNLTINDKVDAALAHLAAVLRAGTLTAASGAREGEREIYRDEDGVGWSDLPDEPGRPVAGTERLREAPNVLGDAQDWKDKLAELYEWSGSAWIAGEKTPEKDATMRAGLYSFLCSLIGYLMAAEEQARALATQDAGTPAEGWPAKRPMSEAPRDGTYILVEQEGVLSPDKTVVQWDASWNDGWWMCCDGKNPELPLRGPDPTGWWPLPGDAL